MIEAGIGTSTHSRPLAAAEEAAAAALAGRSRADAALLFVGPGMRDDMPQLLDGCVEALGTDAVVGASAHGVFASGCETGDEQGLVLLALSGIEALPFLLPDAGGDPLVACDEISGLLGGRGRPEDLVVLLPDPRSFDARTLLPALAETLGPATLVGAGAGDPLSGEPLQWCGRSLASGGASGLVLRAPRPPRIGVTQACRPVTQLLTVTRVRGNWILELDGRPAFDVYREVARGPLAEDLRRAASFLLVARPAEPGREDLVPGSYLVRHVVGFEPDAGAFAIPEAVKPGDRIAFALREPESAREDLKAMLQALADPRPRFGLYFDCCARGTGFFGVAGLEAAYMESVFGPTPIVGMYGSCEIGPVGPRTELLTYTGVLALLDDG